MSDNRPGWYLVCPDCNAKVFVSKWKLWAQFLYNLIYKKDARSCPDGVGGCTLEEFR